MKKQFFRTILMVAGVLTVVVILLSQSIFPPEKHAGPAKPKQTTEQLPGATIINAPADVVPSSAVQLDEVFPTLLRELTSTENNSEIVFQPTTVFVPYFRILFRTLISPNAP